MGGTAEESGKLRTYFFDSALSWISAVVNVVTLFIRIINFVFKPMRLPTAVRENLFAMQNVDLSVEEVIVLDLKTRSIGTGRKYDASELVELMSYMKNNRSVIVNYAKLVSLLENQGLMNTEKAETGT
jgi:hypothetical protein